MISLGKTSCHAISKCIIHSVQSTDSPRFCPMRRLLTASLILATLTSVPAYAVEPVVQKEQVIEVTPINDPIEPFNRAVFQFNKYVDLIVLKPVTYVYKNALPGFVRSSVSSLLDTLGQPIVMLNALLQGDGKTFENSIHRFVINATLGLGGLNDVASSLGVPAANADFGQTLGVWGAGHGFYLVLPILGSSSLRDGVGEGVDAVADPFNIIWSDSETYWPIYTRMGLTAIDARYKYGDAYDDVMKNAVDPYVTFRSMYVQRRAYLVQGKAVDSYDQVEAQ